MAPSGAVYQLCRSAEIWGTQGTQFDWEDGSFHGEMSTCPSCAPACLRLFGPLPLPLPLTVC